MRGLDDTSSRIDSERIFILLIQLFCVPLIFVFPCRLFGQFFTGGWQTLVSILVTIYFGTIVFVRVIVFQCHFLICCCSLSTGCTWDVKVNFPDGVFNFTKNPNEPAKIDYEHTGQISYKQLAILVLILIGVMFSAKQ